MPQAIRDNDPIDITEGPLPVGWDFSNYFPSTTITSIKATSCFVSEGSPVQDPEAATRLTGVPSIISSPASPTGSGRANVAVSQTFQPGDATTAGCIYVLECTVIDTTGATMTLWTHQPIQQPE